MHAAIECNKKRLKMVEALSVSLMYADEMSHG